MTILEKQLIVLMRYGIFIHHADGHRWINAVIEDEIGFEFYYDFNKELQKHGVLLNNKVYGGVIQAIGIIDEVFIKMYGYSLEEHYDHQFEYDWDINTGGYPDLSGIDIVEKGKGGLV